MANFQRIPSELVSSTVYFDYKTPVTKVIPALERYSAVIINKDKQYYGIVDTRVMYRSRTGLRLKKGENVGNFAIKAPKITNSTSIDDVIFYFYRAGVKALPYMSGAKVAGIFERATLMKMLLSLNILHDIKVSEAMTAPVLVIDANASLSQAKAAMRDNKVNRLAVVQNGRLAGLITNHDLMQNYSKTAERLPEMKTEIYTPSNVPVSSVMEKNPQTIDENGSVSDGVRKLIENDISSIIVTRRQAPIGILTVTDVLESIIARKRIEEKRVFISGFDSYTYEYQDEIRESLSSFIDSVERMGGIKVDYVTLRLKRIKSKSYEIQLRLSLGSHGIISIHSNRPSFDEAFREVLQRLKEGVRREKDRIVTNKRTGYYREVAFE